MKTRAQHAVSVELTTVAPTSTWPLYWAEALAAQTEDAGAESRLFYPGVITQNC